MPVALRSPYILDVYEQAATHYLPGIHAGRVIVFKPAEDSVDPRGWESLAVDGLEVHEVPGACNQIGISPSLARGENRVAQRAPMRPRA